MKKKKLVLKTETVRQMQSGSLTRVVGGTSIIAISYTCNATCYNCQYVNTTLVGGTKSYPATLCQTVFTTGGGGDGP
jgi:hypothetical protein